MSHSRAHQHSSPSTGLKCAKLFAVLKGMVEANEKISRDESLYSDFATMLYAMLSNKPSQDAVLSIVKEAVAIEKEFCTVSRLHPT
eukprot:SAG11_NODE_2480_length_3307_cov_3.206983_2_plen_86_part_00